MNQLKRFANFVFGLLGHLGTDLAEVEVFIGSGTFAAGLKLLSDSGLPQAAHVGGVILAVLGPVLILISRAIDMITKFKLAIKTPTLYTVTATSGSAVAFEGQVATVVGDVNKAVDVKTTPPTTPPPATP